jgi:serine phosphatase RsbU (regulator of sigma subunit)
MPDTAPAPPLPDDMSATRPVDRRMSGPNAIALAVLGVCVLCSVLGALIARSIHDDSEHRLLQQRTNEAGALLTNAIGNIQTPLAAAAELAEVSNGDPRSFQAALDRSIERDQFAAAVLLDADTAEAVATVGDVSRLETTPDEYHDVIERSVTTESLTVIDLVQRGRRIGYAYNAMTAGDPELDFVVYAEAQLAEEATSAGRSDGPFGDLDYALYLGDDVDEASLLVATTTDLPIDDDEAVTTVPFGDESITFVSTTTTTLGSGLSAALPWLIVVSGIAFGIVAAITTRALATRRRDAERLAATIGALYDEQQHHAETLRRSLLPRETPVPDGTEVELRYWPADTSNEIGGDFYDLFPLDDRRWGLVMGDVCGKGVEAAALTGLTRHTIRAAARHLRDPAEVLRWAHDAIAADTTSTYCTVCYAVITIHDDGTRELQVALGGHPPLLVASGGVVEPVGRPGTVLGMIAPQIHVDTRSLRLGDTIVLYTDGVTDAPGHAALSDEELVSVIREHADASPPALADAIHLALQARQRGGSVDDTAVMIVRITADVTTTPAGSSETTSDHSVHPPTSVDVGG